LFSTPGADPTIIIYNAAKNYNATRSLVRSERKNNYFYFVKNALDYYNSGVVVVNSGVEGLDPGQNLHYFTPTSYVTYFSCPINWKKIIIMM
jgi:hypothetical protein